MGISNLSLSFTRQEISHYIDSMQDPLSLDCLEDAMVLVPCGHSVSWESALTLFGKLHIVHVDNDHEQDVQQKSQTVQQNGQDLLQVERSRPCPTCRRLITLYIPNFTLRDMKPLIEKMEACAKEELCPDSPLLCTIQGQAQVNLTINQRHTPSPRAYSKRVDSFQKPLYFNLCHWLKWFFR